MTSGADVHSEMSEALEPADAEDGLAHFPSGHYSANAPGP
jgi:hypothetical protein